MADWLVGVPTYRRPEELDRALSSLVKQKQSPAFDVCVVDNDPAGSARSVTEKYTKNLRLIYLLEPRPGVVHVRNRLLDQADEYHVLAFLDDDELADEFWLCELRRGMNRFPLSVIAGHVRYELEQVPESSALANFTFQRPPRLLGEQLLSTGTGNSAIPLFALDPSARNLRFNPKYSAIGGEDTHYFAELSERGYDVRAWPPAIVIEVVPAERSTPHVIRRRLRRSGHVSAMIQIENRNRLEVATAYLARLIIGSVLSVMACSKGRKARGIALRQSGLGGLDAVFSVSRRYYGS